MAVASVTAQNIRVFDAQSTVGITSIGGGSGAAIETDFKYNDVNCIARKGTTGERGFQYDAPSPQDLSGGVYSTMMLKLICTTPNLLDLKNTQAFSWRSGSAAGAYYQHDIHGSDTYPITRSWVLPAIDPNVASHRSSTVGSPALTAVDYYALIYDQSGTSKSPNQGFAAIDIGAGLTISGGDGVSADATWQDLIDFDWGTETNRFGYVQESDGSIIVTGKIVRGGAATEWTDGDKNIAFADGLFAAGFSGIEDDLTSASTVIIESGTQFNGLGTEAGEDTRPIHEVTGSNGSAEYSACGFKNFSKFDLNSAVSFVANGTFKKSGVINQLGATITDQIISESTATSAIVVTSIANMAAVTKTSFVDNAGHSIEYTGEAGTVALSGIEFSGGGADGTTTADFYNNSGEAITLSIVGGGNSPTVRNGAGSSTTISNPLSYTITSLNQFADVTISDITDPANPVELFNEVAGADGIVTYPFAGSLSGTPIGVYARNTLIRNEEFDDVLPAANVSFPISQKTDNVYI